MAELNLKQIVDKLNTEFVGDTRNREKYIGKVCDFHVCDICRPIYQYGTSEVLSGNL